MKIEYGLIGAMAVTQVVAEPVTVRFGNHIIVGLDSQDVEHILIFVAMLTLAVVVDLYLHCGRRRAN